MAGFDESFEFAVGDFLGGTACSNRDCAKGRRAPTRIEVGSLGRHWEARRVREADRVALWSERIATGRGCRLG